MTLNLSNHSANVTIGRAQAHSAIGGKLNQMALDYMAYCLSGSENQSVLAHTFRKLWKSGGNRFSHEYAFEARAGERIVGMVTCYPVKVLKSLAWPTFKQLITLRKLELLWYNLRHLKLLYSMISMTEGEDDEFHIGTLASLPESRGLGVGTKLLACAEEEAVRQGFSKCSLTVKKENERAFRLYQRLGYRVSGEINKPAFSMYRMVKTIG